MVDLNLVSPPPVPFIINAYHHLLQSSFLFKIKMVDLLHCLKKQLYFAIPFQLYIYINLSSKIICCLFSGDMYLSFGISNKFSAVSSVCMGIIDLLVILSSIL